MGKLTGNRPAGSASPKRTLVTASPPCSPGYHASRTAPTRSSQRVMVTALPPMSTTTTGLPVAATRRISLSWPPRVGAPPPATEPAGHGAGAAADEHDHNGPAGRRDAEDQILLATRQAQRGPIAELSLFDARHDDGDVARPRDSHGTVEAGRLAARDPRVPDQLEARVPRRLEVFDLERMAAPGQQSDRDEQ